MRKLHARAVITDEALLTSPSPDTLENKMEKLRHNLARTLADDSTSFIEWSSESTFDRTHVLAATLLVLDKQDFDDLSTILARVSIPIGDVEGKAAYERLWAVLDYYMRIQPDWKPS